MMVWLFSYSDEGIREAAGMTGWCLKHVALGRRPGCFPLSPPPWGPSPSHLLAAPLQTLPRVDPGGSPLPPPMPPSLHVPWLSPFLTSLLPLFSDLWPPPLLSMIGVEGSVTKGKEFPFSRPWKLYSADSYSSPSITCPKGPLPSLSTCFPAIEPSPTSLKTHGQQPPPSFRALQPCSAKLTPGNQGWGLGEGRREKGWANEYR